MKRYGSYLITIFVTVGLLASVPAHARRRRRRYHRIQQQQQYEPSWDMPVLQHPYGVGLMIGEPIGLTGIYRMSATRAIDAALAYSTIDDNHMQLHADYLFLFPNRIHLQNYAFTPYVGGGVQLRGFDAAIFGVRVPLGISHFFDDQQTIEGFVELAPGFGMNSSTSSFSGTFDFDIGGRWYF